MNRLVAFGEILLRLSPPGRELLLQTPGLDVWVGGAEANVATALARLGHDAALDVDDDERQLESNGEPDRLALERDPRA